MSKLIGTLLLSLSANLLTAQQVNIVSSDIYKLAESRLGYNTEPLVDNNFNGRPNWLPGDRFWYRVLTARGSEFILVNPAKSSRAMAFNQEKVAAALSGAAGKSYTAWN